MLGESPGKSLEAVLESVLGIVLEGVLRRFFWTLLDSLGESPGRSLEIDLETWKEFWRRF